jgi:glycosyltransferase involved in cell wall biosynthesis
LVDAFKVRVPDFSSWVHSFNIFMVTELSHISGIDLVHVHDWLTAPAGIVLKHRFKVPLIATIHATEYGRRGGLHSLESRHIHEWEWLLAYEAWKVIVCSSFMANEVKSILGVPSDKVIMIPNGVDKSLLNFKPKYERSNYALPWELLVVFYGRLVYEKGPDSVIRAFAKLLTRLGNVKLVIIGDGPMREHLVNLVNQLGLGSKVYFTGRVSDDELYSVIYHSNLVILPSRYEPFGISSLEAMALGKPLIATNRGGPTDFVKHMDNGILANPDNPDEIAYYAEMVLKDEGLAKRLGERARETVTKGYTWDIIARKTYETYKATLEERVRVNW